MNKAQILQELRKIKDVAFATVDSEGRQQVRIIDVMLADEETIYFCTARGKAFYHQLCEGGYVAVSGLNKQFQMFRISGKAQKLGDQRRWIDEIFARNPSMNDVYPRDSRYILEPFFIRIEQMEWFDLGVSPICRGEISLSTEKGFVIGPNCIGCGKCMRSCPQQCICAGSPYQIAQEHCLHCGLCAETCPVHAILPGGEHA